MNTLRHCVRFPIFAAAFIAASSAWAVTLGQIDNFEDGTTQGWIVSAGGIGPAHPAPPSNELGGPAGADDNYLKLTAIGGDQSGGRLSVLNLSQWSGDYLAAGVGSISMDVNNFGPDTLSLRLMFEDPMMGPPTNVAYSDEPIVLPAGSGWTRIVFPIDPGSLNAGLGDINTVLANTTAIRLYHSIADNFSNPVFPIEPVNVVLGVDNIQAGPRVPDGGSTAMLLLPVLFAAGCCRRRYRAAT